MYVNALNPMKEKGCREFIAFHRETGMTSILSRKSLEGSVPACEQYSQEINARKKKLGGR